MWHLIRTILLILPTLLFDIFAWVFKYSNHPEKYPLDIRYKKTRKLISKACKYLKMDILEEGRENIPEGTCCFFSNHLGAVDPLPIIALNEKPTTFVAKIEIKKMPIVGRIFTGIDGLFLDRDNLKQQFKVMMKVQESLKNNTCNWVIFPEGTRNKDPMNKLLDFHHGTFRAAMKANVPLVPMVCFGSFRVLNLKHSYKSYPILVKYLPPIMPEEYKDKTTEEISKIIQSRIQKEVTFYARSVDLKRMSELHDKYYRFNKVK